MDIKQLFQAYRENRMKQQSFQEPLFSCCEREEWNNCYQEMLQNQMAISQENDRLLEELHALLQEPLVENTAETLYEQSLQMYLEGIDDYHWLLSCYDILIDYYENEKHYDKEKLIWLYCAHFYEYNKVKMRQFDSEVRDYTYLYKILEWKDQYADFTEGKERNRFWVAYYNLTLSYFNNINVPLAKGFQTIEEMLSFWNSETVSFLDGDNTEMQNMIWESQKNQMRAIFRMEEEIGEDAQNQFCEAATVLYQNEMQKVKSEYELDFLLYAGNLYSLYLQKKRNINEIFDSYMDYYGYRSFKYKNEEIPSIEAIQFYIDSTEVMVLWANLGVEKEKIHKMTAAFMHLVEKKWKNSSYQNMTYLNTLMKKMCPLMIRYGGNYVSEEECVKQMILKRNVFLYLHCKKVQDVSLLILDSILRIDPDILYGFHFLSREDLIELVSGHALFHDIGKIDMCEIIYGIHRSKTEEEKNFLMSHPIRGGAFVENYPNLRKYWDTIRLHHISYDGKKGYPQGYAFENPENKIITNLVHIADVVVCEMEKQFCRGEHFEIDSYFALLQAESGTEFHPKIVASMKADQILQKNLAEFVSIAQLDDIFQLYHELNRVSIHQSFDECYEEVNRKYVELREKGQIDQIKSYFDKLLEIASGENSNRNLGITYYLMTRYLFESKKYMECVNYALEAVRYLEKTNEYVYLCNIYNALGYIMQYQENSENAIRYYLRCVEYSKKNPGSEYIRGLALHNIGTMIMESYHFEKALFYFESALELLSFDDQFAIRITGGIIYCSLVLQNMEKLYLYLEKMEELRQKVSFEDFDLHVILSCVYYALGEYEKMEMEMRRIEKDQAYLEEMRNYCFEIHLYLDLLRKLQKYDKMVEAIDMYIENCQNKQIFSSIFTDLVQRRILLAYIMKDQENISYYGKYLYAFIKEYKDKRAEHALQIEKTYEESIAIQRRYREIMTKRKKLEQEVMVAEQDNAKKTKFLTNMSHEIRTPIHAILGLDEMIIRECHDDQILQYAYDIQNAGKTLMGIINDVLDISKMEEGKMELNKASYQLVDIIRELKNMIEPRAKDKKLDFCIVCDQEIPKELYGDCLRIKQVILNVLTNAVKYTKEGKVTFSISYEKVDEEHINLSVLVEDTGIGMKPEHLEKLSNPFVRFDEDKNRNVEGTGLGMNIVTNLIKQMEGTLQVESEYGKGSSFHISIPQTVLNWKGVGDFLAPAKNENRENQKALFVAPEAEVLLVDDNKVNLKVVSSLLKRTKVKVTTAAGGRECLELCEKNRYHLILLDHRMPELDGVETLKLLKQMKGLNGDTPVIALTANAVVGGEEFYKSKGFDELVTKPVDYVELERKMKYFLPAKMVQEQLI